MDQNLVTPYYEQIHFGFQYQIGKDMVLESNYVGTFGHKLTDIEGRANFDGQTACASPPPGGYPAGSPCYNAGYPDGFSDGHINPAYGNISFRTNCCDSNYHGWQTTFRKRFSNGLQFNANYTFSKGMDDVSDAFTTKNAGGAMPTRPTAWIHTLTTVRPTTTSSTGLSAALFTTCHSPSQTGGSVAGTSPESSPWQSGADFSVINSQSR